MTVENEYNRIPTENWLEDKKNNDSVISSEWIFLKRAHFGLLVKNS